MVYEKKAQSALVELLNAIYYEEGRLALINKLGPALSDEDKMKATQLITVQRANLDRLLELFKKDLEPLMSDIYKNGEAMAPLVSKLVSTSTQGLQVEEFTNNEVVMIDDAPVEEASVTDNTISEVVPGANEVPAENNEVVAASGDTAVVASDGTMEVTGESASAAEVTSGEVAAPAEGNSEMVVSENSVVASDGTGSEVPSEVSVEVPATEAAPAEDAAPFVLSPMDEDVAPVPIKEEVQAAAEGVAAAERQLQTIEGMKNDIINDTSITDTEKTVSLGKYSRMTADVVRAILVTKTQYEKLLASRNTQKALLNPVTSEEVKEEGAASEASATEVNVDSAPAETTASSDNGGGFLPTVEIGTDTGSVVANDVPVEGTLVLPMINNDSVPAEQTAATETTGGVLELSTAGAAPSEDTSVESQSGANELQAMIEQANALYKEGKTAEAQALFEKIGAMNNASQGGEEKSDAAVLVKK